MKCVQVLCESKKSWEDAVQNAVKRASKTIKNIKSVNVNNMSAVVNNDQVTLWRANIQLTFEVKD